MWGHRSSDERGTSRHQIATTPAGWGTRLRYNLVPDRRGLKDLGTSWRQITAAPAAWDGEAVRPGAGSRGLDKRGPAPDRHVSGCERGPAAVRISAGLPRGG